MFRRRDLRFLFLSLRNRFALRFEDLSGRDLKLSHAYSIDFKFAQLANRSQARATLSPIDPFDEAISAIH
ncbi:hypothetical protein Scep_012225 [Stephania cephalantha]|uniref:Uncharacterized protein n=1 Tax=Stephania cephalantha TaxID=152367 RepID=A0AAP0P6A4_9MAGN